MTACGPIVSSAGIEDAGIWLSGLKVARQVNELDALWVGMGRDGVQLLPHGLYQLFEGQRPVVRSAL